MLFRPDLLCSIPFCSVPFCPYPSRSPLQRCSSHFMLTLIDLHLKWHRKASWSIEKKYKFILRQLKVTVVSGKEGFGFFQNNVSCCPNQTNNPLSHPCHMRRGCPSSREYWEEIERSKFSFFWDRIQWLADWLTRLVWLFSQDFYKVHSFATRRINENLSI